jgi:hypothetical protein
MVGRCCCLRLASITFITRVGFSTSTLAYVLDSLVRVSRRVGKNHFGKIAKAPQATSPPENLSRRISTFCGEWTSFCLTTKTKADVSPSASSSPCGSRRMQWLDNHTRPSPKNKFLPLPSQRFQVFWLSFQSSFHLSFTVLVRYRFPIYI